MRKYILFISIVCLASSCADEKTLTINGRNKTFDPYGWADYEELKNDSVTYEICVGNVVWSVIGFETIAIPVWLTGWQIYEPIKVKDEFARPIKNINDTIKKFTVIQ